MARAAEATAVAVGCVMLVATGGGAAAMTLTLAKCITGAPNQTFQLATVPPYVAPAAIRALAVKPDTCLEVEGESYGDTGGPAAVGSPVVGAPCGGNPMGMRANQYWTIGSQPKAPQNVMSLQVDTPYCLGVSGGGGGILANCSSDDALLRAEFSARKPGALVHTPTGACVTLVGLPPLPTPPPPPPPPLPPSPPCSTPPPPPPPPPKGPGGLRPCDIYASVGAECVAAHSMARALYADYTGPLYLVRRASDRVTLQIGVGQRGGFADTSPQVAFCHGTDCVVETIFDQSPRGNDLRANHPGRHFPVDKGVNASRHPVQVNATPVYGAWFDQGMGYRNDQTNGLARGDASQSIYAVFGNGHYNDMCCFDYGNAESHIGADGPGTMEAIYFGNCTSWWTPQAKHDIPPDWHGPYLMADIEAGMYAGNSSFNPANSPIDQSVKFVSLMLKGRPCQFSLKAGDAQKGALSTKYNGMRPTHADWNPMRKQGGLILGTGGDNSDRSLGIFYEGAIASGYVDDVTDDAIQANIVAAKYNL